MGSETKKAKCFVISPIGGANTEVRRHADMTLNLIVKAALQTPPLEYEVHRADEDSDPGLITDLVVRSIIESELCIADLTFLNPNVFYELGIRHYAQKPVIHMASRETVLPFDNANQSTVFFDPFDFHSIEATKKEIVKKVGVITSPNFSVNNPVTRAHASSVIKSQGDPDKILISELMSRLERIEAKAFTRNIEYRPSAGYYPDETDVARRILSIVRKNTYPSNDVEDKNVVDVADTRKEVEKLGYIITDEVVKTVIAFISSEVKNVNSLAKALRDSDNYIPF